MGCAACFTQWFCVVQATVAQNQTAADTAEEALEKRVADLTARDAQLEGQVTEMRTLLAGQGEQLEEVRFC